MRRLFHEQLASLWRQLPLNEHAPQRLDPTKTGSRDDVNLLRQVGSFQFAPLVSGAYGWNTVAELEILFLRPAPPGEVIKHGGDIDNRLKTLFDAFRMPSLDELPKSDVPKPGEDPFYVLLEDDALVTGFSVITDRLLTPSASEGQVELIIHVKVSTTRSSMVNIGL